jgi:hypothetical protein
MAALSKSNPGDAILKDATINIAVCQVFHVGAERAILPGKEVVIGLIRFFKVCSTH